ncbi:MAG: TonB-dependent receptor plug domain-containing protein [Bacteroidota bacterium]|nr:TonB-dependent receptor plug domain-containing protein [Bacteroidota bacterium]
MMKKILAYLLFLLPWTALPAQSQKMTSGRVVDRATREPLELAVVHDLATGKNSFTDKEGRFVLPGTAAGKGSGTPAGRRLGTMADSVSIVVSFIGYGRREIRIAAGVADAVVGLEKSSLDLAAVTISSKAGAGSFHTLSQIDLNMQPARSAQDLLRLVPGLFIAQHQGGGKAEQIFLRGFDADHGTDVSLSVDGMPVNLVSHSNGQGYADLHFLIPETVSGYEFGKGPYYADRGDFTTAGYVGYRTISVLDRNRIEIEGGQFHTRRAVAMINLLSERAKERGQSAYIAGEALYFDGPFDYAERFTRSNLFGKWITPVGANNKLTLTLSTMSSGWRASGEIPERAVAEGTIPDRFGVIDSAQGGYTSRSNAAVKLSSTLKDHFTLENQVYYSRYFFNLISNFTYHYFYPAAGDEFRQHESRNLAGYNGRLTHVVVLPSGRLSSTIGASLRSDAIDPSYLAHTLGGQTILHYIQLGKIRETNASGIVEESFESGKWLFAAGLRLDYFHFYYGNLAPASDSAAAIYSGVAPVSHKAILCPKVSVQYTASPEWQLYIKSGKGFHSNDARIVIAHDGHEILPAAYGADLGVNWRPHPNWFINAAIWQLYLEQEFTFGADLGDQAVSPGGRTLRKGIDLSVRYQINSWLYTYLNTDLARPKALDALKGRDYLPLAPTLTSTGGLDARLRNGINGSIGYRTMRNRAANADYSLTARGHFVTDLTVNYTRKKFEIGVAVENLFNVTWNEAEFETTSQLKNETHPVDEVSFTPGNPFFAKLKGSIFF